MNREQVNTPGLRGAVRGVDMAARRLQTFTLQLEDPAQVDALARRVADEVCVNNLTANDALRSGKVKLGGLPFMQDGLGAQTSTGPVYADWDAFGAQTNLGELKAQLSDILYCFGVAVYIERTGTDSIRDLWAVAENDSTELTHYAGLGVLAQVKTAIGKAVHLKWTSMTGAAAAAATPARAGAGNGGGAGGGVALVADGGSSNLRAIPKDLQEASLYSKLDTLTTSSDRDLTHNNFTGGALQHYQPIVDRWELWVREERTKPEWETGPGAEAKHVRRFITKYLADIDPAATAERALHKALSYSQKVGISVSRYLEEKDNRLNRAKLAGELAGDVDPRVATAKERCKQAMEKMLPELRKELERTLASVYYSGSRPSGWGHRTFTDFAIMRTVAQQVATRLEIGGSESSEDEELPAKSGQGRGRGRSTRGRPAAAAAAAPAAGAGSRGRGGGGGGGGGMKCCDIPALVSYFPKGDDRELPPKMQGKAICVFVWHGLTCPRANKCRFRHDLTKDQHEGSPAAAAAAAAPEASLEEKRMKSMEDTLKLHEKMASEQSDKLDRLLAAVGSSGSGASAEADTMRQRRQLQNKQAAAAAAPDPDDGKLQWSQQLMAEIDED